MTQDNLYELLLPDERDPRPPFHLCAALGLGQAVVFARIYMWVESNRRLGKARTNHRDGRWWAYGTIADWHQTYFPFMGNATLRRYIDELVARGVLIKGNYNRMPSDRTLWYSVSLPALRLALREYAEAHSEALAGPVMDDLEADA